ncbi:hypothetical protein [Acinetobacter nosocomialis]|uniref:hypothetical protein n=1 Tax=Acinetobacter nosocomialis TaxID=106654 RepID=UPI00125090C2|nr:hypothetical protein [Acinetobacter nosocomialis]
MLEIEVNFPDNLYTQMIFESKKLPCLCKISKEFFIDFLVSHPQVSGKVLNWKFRDIDLRIPAGAGGEYLHYKYGLITISNKQDNIYIIDDLEMFALGFGWGKIIENRNYADVPKVEEPDWLKQL